jgi:hypothetical protein
MTIRETGGRRPITSALSYGNENHSGQRGTGVVVLGPLPAVAVAAFILRPPEAASRFLPSIQYGAICRVFWMIRRALENTDPSKCISPRTTVVAANGLDTGAVMDQFVTLMLGFGHERF